MPGDANSIIKNRQMSPEDVLAALTTYMPSGKHDDYMMFASGGHGGQVLVIGVPSMRLLKVIGVFTPEPWQGWGFSEETRAVINGKAGDGTDLLWGDTHHPALSETNGEYDGQFLFINDKASARVAVIDLRDFETKQIVKNPLAINDHGGAFVTPDTEWVIEGGQYAHPIGGKYASLADYKKSYRGLVTCWKFDRKKGSIDPSKSFAIELPPYWQDLSDAGKLVSDGWIFLNSFNTEMATGGGEKKGGVWFEAGTTQRDMDYLHVINLKKAIATAAAGKTTTINGFRMIPLQTAASESILYFAPEPKSPHGVDVTPGGEYMVVSGKLDPHVTIFSFQKMMDAIKNKSFSGKDPYGVPIFDFKKVVEKQVELGLGPLHTQFDDKGYAYTSLFLDSAVARWSLGGPYEKLHSDKPWTLVKKIPVQYNVGHLAAAEGDTAKPAGHFLVALNKWSVDRFANVGPLLPQNLQLVDISNPGDKMQVLYDMPIGIGEPHYSQIIKADKIKAWDVYPEIGWSPVTQSKSPKATTVGQERIVRNGNTVEVFMTAIRSHLNPEHVEVKKGDKVIWHVTNVERARDATHGFALFNHNLSLEPGETETISFTATKEGVYPYYCTEFCSALHLEMTGYLLVKP
ncbi:MAG: Sec-dependent nitrous-oxide reductase [Armatimonadetes bacterium]|nr:Sec-dependent nitrous-oxide reductase [Armatimonadota bacterium]